MLAEVIVDGKFAVLNQQHDAGREELLADGSNLIDSVGARGGVMFHVCDPVCRRSHHNAILDYSNRNGRNVSFLHDTANEVVDVISTKGGCEDENQTEREQKMPVSLHGRRRKG
jgi:hypothetical protein